MASNRPGHQFVRELERGRQLFFNGDRDGAAALFRQILERDRNQPDALHYSGVIAYLEHRYEDAIRLLRRALPQRGQDSELSSNLGLALQADGQFTAAITAFRRAAALAPAFPQHQAYLANALRDAGLLPEAVAACNQALTLEPRFALPRFSRALCTLLAGDWRTPWPDYEWRVAADSGTEYAAAPGNASALLPRPSQWRTAMPDRPRILVLAEQGLGDELFFLRYAPLVREHCEWLGYRTGQKLAPLLTGAAGIDQVIATEAALPPFDFALLVGDLPLLCADLPLETPPPSLPLVPRPECRHEALQRLHQAGPGPYLGISWRAGPAPVPGEKPGRRKRVPLGPLADAISQWPGTFVSLQRQPGEGEISQLAALLGRPVADFDSANEDLSLMLGVTSLLDEYVGVSNTNMYLRAAAGRQARVMVTVPPDWRWTESATVSPWFPDFRLYRECRQHGWDPALTLLREDLKPGASGPG